ncbi:unnamed protein product [Mesocestoides corti]|uniref:histone acetyltransferase n=1 Tax=Mesocestoides corti TaxID=53468 RepID=A0A0R3URT9_MESCO|nr:unnamed protein product [Mesocestoides corti]
MGVENSLSSIINEYEADALGVVHFKLIREKEDLDSDESFNPDMTHQVFGESETIFGYKDLDVTIAYMAGSLSTFIDIRYSEKIPRSLSNGAEPDDIYKILKKFYTQELITSKARFLETFQEELMFKPFGQLKSGYTIKSDGKSREFVVHFVDYASPDFEAFSSYLTRMEPFVLFFVDGSSFIDLDDRWNFYVL